MCLSKWIFFAALFGMLALLPPDQARSAGFPRSGTAMSGHSLANAPGGLRLELYGVRSFLTVKTGDSKGEAGELHRISVQLTNRAPRVNEFVIREWTSLLLINQTRHKGGGSAYVKVRQGDLVVGQIRTPERPLWINVRPGDSVRLEIVGRELDCAGHRVCGRGDKSHYSIDLTVPRLSRLSGRCTPQNTWNLYRSADNRFRFRPPRENPVSERGGLMLYPIAGKMCFLSRVGESLSLPLNLRLMPSN